MFGGKIEKFLFVAPFESVQLPNSRKSWLFLKLDNSLFSSIKWAKWINLESTKEQSSSSKLDCLRPKEYECWTVGLLQKVFLKIGHSWILVSDSTDKPVVNGSIRVILILKEKIWRRKNWIVTSNNLFHINSCKTTDQYLGSETFYTARCLFTCDEKLCFEKVHSLNVWFWFWFGFGFGFWVCAKSTVVHLWRKTMFWESAFFECLVLVLVWFWFWFLSLRKIYSCSPVTKNYVLRKCL